MKTSATINKMSAEKKTAMCIVMSMFYFAMLAYPFGVVMEGYVWQKAVIAGVIFFAISIPAWIVNLKREFYDATASAGETAELLDNGLMGAAAGNSNKACSIDELARMNKWLSLEDIAQIRFCQDGERGSTFEQIAVKRNYLTHEQLDTLLAMQGARA